MLVFWSLLQISIRSDAVLLFCCNCNNILFEKWVHFGER